MVGAIRTFAYSLIDGDHPKLRRRARTSCEHRFLMELFQFTPCENYLKKFFAASLGTFAFLAAPHSPQFAQTKPKEDERRKRANGEVLKLPATIILVGVNVACNALAWNLNNSSTSQLNNSSTRAPPTTALEEASVMHRTNLINSKMWKNKCRRNCIWRILVKGRTTLNKAAVRTECNLPKRRGARERKKI